jgi:hypothetical protein
MERAQWTKKMLESSMVAKVAIFLLTILGTSMVISDGVLTPAISGNYITGTSSDAFYWLFSWFQLYL